MKRILRTLLSSFALATFFPLLVFAADDAPAITILQAGADRIKEDIKFVLDLTTPAEQKEWETVEDYLDDVFLLGIDGTRPIRIDLITDSKAMGYRSSFPITDDDEFLESLNLFGITTKRKTRTYYELGKAFVGILRLIDGYGVIGPDRNAVPARGFDPIDDKIKKYGLDKTGKVTLYDTLLILLNEKGTAKSRRAAFQDVKKELMAAVQQIEDESKEDYELRKALTELQIDELARYYADPKELTLGWNTDTKEKQGKLTLNLLPDKGTLLKTAVDQLGTRASHFAAAPSNEKAILSGRINMPLDDEQQTNISGVLILLRDRAHAEIDAADDINAEQKTAFKEILTLLVDSATTTAKETGFDGYVQCIPKESGKHTLVGGVIMKKSEQISQIFKLFPVVRPDRQINLAMDKQGDVVIHQFDFSDSAKPAMEDFFGVKGMYVAVGPKAVWYAMGEDALVDLKAAIETVASAEEQKPTNDFMTFMIKCGPFSAWRDRHDIKTEPVIKQTSSSDDSTADKKKKVTDLPIRELAIIAFEPGDDTITIKMSRDEDRVVGDMNADTGILRLVGKLIAQFSKDTLAE